MTPGIRPGPYARCHVITISRRQPCHKLLSDRIRLYILCSTAIVKLESYLSDLSWKRIGSKFQR